MYHTEEGVLCVQGNGYESKATSTIAMIFEAIELLKKHRSQSLPPFSMKTISISDIDKTCKSDFAYSIPWKAPRGCTTRLVPDFTFWKWPEAGFLPDYASVTRKLNDISRSRALSRKCGWAGGVGTKPRRAEFVGLVKDFQNVDIVISESIDQKDAPGAWSMEKQAKEWACMIDLPGYGFSGRVPMLLHTGRPLLALERPDWTCIRGRECAICCQPFRLAAGASPGAPYSFDSVQAVLGQCGPRGVLLSPSPAPPQANAS